MSVKTSQKQIKSADICFYIENEEETVSVPFNNPILFCTNISRVKFRNLKSIIGYIQASEYPILLIYQRGEKYPMAVHIPYEQIQDIKQGVMIQHIVIRPKKFGQSDYFNFTLKKMSARSKRLGNPTKPMTYWQIFPISEWANLHSQNHPGFRYIISQLTEQYVPEYNNDHDAEEIDENNKMDVPLTGIKYMMVQDILESGIGSELYDSNAYLKKSKYHYLQELINAVHPEVLFTPIHELLNVPVMFCEKCGEVINPITHFCYQC